MTTTTTTTWVPTVSEVAAILTEMGPVIRAFAERDARRLEVWASEDRMLQPAA